MPLHFLLNLWHPWILSVGFLLFAPVQETRMGNVFWSVVQLGSNLNLLFAFSVERRRGLGIRGCHDEFERSPGVR